MRKTQSHNRLLHAESAGGIPVLTITGTPRSMGTSLGERLQPRIDVLLQDLLQALAKVCDDGRLIDESGGLRFDQAEDWLHELLDSSGERMREADPTMWMELQSMAEACEVDIVFLLAIHAYNDILHHFAREHSYFESDCLSLQARHSIVGAPILAMDWAIPPYLLPHLLLIRRIPAHGPATITLSLAGLHTVAGISASGVAITSNDLRDVFNESPGLPSTSMIQLALSASTYGDALAKIRRLPFMGGRSVHLLGPGQRTSLEIAGEFRFELPAPFVDAPRIHTNHRLHDGAPADASVAVCWSRQRLQRLARNIAQCGPETSLEQIDRWFDTGQDRDQTRLRQPSRERPVSAAIVVLDPEHRCIHCHGGGAPGTLKPVGL